MKKIFFSLLFIFVLISCTNDDDLNVNQVNNNNEIIDNNNEQKNSDENIEKKVVYTSIYPIYFLAKSFLWNNAEVINITPSWWEPHHYEPSLKQIWEMWKANLIILNWLWLEPYEEKLIENLQEVNIVMISEKLSNLLSIEEHSHKEEHDVEHEDHEEEHQNWEEYYWDHDHWNIDPHTWLSPKLYLELANILYIELENNWFENLDKSIIQDLENLEIKYNEWLSNCKKDKIVTTHKAFWYLARDYWFEQKAILWINPEEEPSAKDITTIIDFIKEQNLNYIYSEKFLSQKLSDTVKNEVWINSLVLQTLETIWEEKDDNYITIMNENLDNLKIWLECK